MDQGPLDDENLNNQLNLQNISHSGKCSIEHYLIQDRSALFFLAPVGHYSSESLCSFGDILFLSITSIHVSLFT